MLKKFFCGLIFTALISDLIAAPSNFIDKTSYDPQSVKNIDANLNSESLTIRTSNTSDIVVEFYSKKKKINPVSHLVSSTLVIEAKTCEVIINVPPYMKFNKIHISSLNGNVKIDNCITGDFSFSSTTGSVSVRELSCKSLNISSVTGTIGLELQNAPTEKSSVSTTSGLVFVSLPSNSSFSVNVNTVTGDFTNSFTREKLNALVNYRKEINGGGAQLKLSSTSGTITLDSNTFISSPEVVFENDTDEEIPVVIFDEKDFQ